METKAVVGQTWDDLVFLNRNREYGAYTLRREYANRVIIGTGTTILFFLLLVGGALLSRNEPHIVHSKPKEVLGEVKITEFVFEKEIAPPKRSISLTAEKPRSNTPPVVVTTVVEPVQIENTQTVGTADVSAVPVEGDAGSAEGVSQVSTSTLVVEDVPVNFAEVMPAYEGGIKAMMKFLQKNLRYPASAKRLGIEGPVYVSFVVRGDGEVTDVIVLRGIHPDCDAEAKRVILMLSGWIGGKQNGNPVAVRMVLPIKFEIN